MSNKAYNYQKENGFVEFGTGGKNYHMDFAALQNFMPEKAELVQKVFEKQSGDMVDYWSGPRAHSIPVYDIDSGRVYYSMALDRVLCMNSSVRSYISMSVRKCLDQGTPMQCLWDDLKGFENVHLHHFIAVEDVPLKILKVAVERQLHPEIERKEANNFLEASRKLDIALYEAKRLLKE